MSVSEKLIINLKNYNNRYSLYLNRRHNYIRNMFNYARQEYRNTVYFQYIDYLYKLNQQRTIQLRRNHPYITRMYNAFLAAKQAVAAEQAAAEQAAAEQAAAEQAAAEQAAAEQAAAEQAAAEQAAAEQAAAEQAAAEQAAAEQAAAEQAAAEQAAAEQAAAEQAAAEQQEETKKSALLIGINYKGTNAELRGCENDILDTKKILIDKYGFKEDEIIMLAESFGENPTRGNILKHMQNLVNKSNNGYKSLWFQYSGHGYYTSDYNGDEKDRKDECIVTSDMKFITDDEFRKSFTTQINKDTKMFCLMDCCHSGTIMDLNYKYTSNRSNWTTENNYTVNANIISISGCRDNQTSADAWLNSNWCGAMTTSFLDTMNKTDYNPKMFKLLSKMRTYLRKNRFTQIPQLTTTEIIDHDTGFSI